MTIERIDSDLSTTRKIQLLNDMILELSGKIDQAKFDKNELDMLFGVLPTSRQYNRNVGIGNTLSTYTGWSHIKAEAGYSIWKYTPTTYKHSSLNRLYFDDKTMENRGSANSETATSFDSVFLYNGDSGSGYSNRTTEAGTEEGTAFALMNTRQDYLYCGLSTTFAGMKFEFQTRGSNYTLLVEYWNGSAWTPLTTTANSLEDGTVNFQGNGHISWLIPSTWATTTVNSVTSKYWIRISTTTDPITEAQGYFIIPSNSVIGVLALSNDEILNEEWAWCTYNNSVYATLRNTGRTASEGDFYITSSSSTTNLQNFFVYNHPFTMDYEDNVYTPVKTVSTAQSGLQNTDGVIFIDGTQRSVDVDLPSAVGRAGRKFIIKVVDKGSGKTATVSAPSGQTIDGAPTYAFTNDFECITVVSDGLKWFIIAKKS